jgi:hypothetical protein
VQRNNTIPVIDMHIHLGDMVLGENYLTAYDTLEQKELLQSCGLSKALVLERIWGDKYLKLKEKLAPAGDYFELFPSFDIYKVEEPDFDGLIYRTLRDYKKDGVKGLKLWKDITQKLRDKNGKVIPVDSPLFKPIWAYAGEFELPIIFHHAGQPAFFEPMTPDNIYYQGMLEHPEWRFNLPGIPSFEEHMTMQENLLADNPKTQFVIAHVTGAINELPRVSAWLDKYPNMFVDIAARVGQLANQSEAAREFLIRNADRVMFGTDYSPSKSDTHAFYQKYFSFLEEDGAVKSPYSDETDSSLKGVGLPEDVLAKIYHGTTQRVLKV